MDGLGVLSSVSCLTVSPSLVCSCVLGASTDNTHSLLPPSTHSLTLHQQPIKNNPLTPSPSPTTTHHNHQSQDLHGDARRGSGARCLRLDRGDQGATICLWDDWLVIGVSVCVWMCGKVKCVGGRIERASVPWTNHNEPTNPNHHHHETNQTKSTRPAACAGWWTRPSPTWTRALRPSPPLPPLPPMAPTTTGKAKGREGSRGDWTPSPLISPCRYESTWFHYTIPLAFVAWLPGLFVFAFYLPPFSADPPTRTTQPTHPPSPPNHYF